MGNRQPPAVFIISAFFGCQLLKLPDRYTREALVYPFKTKVTDGRKNTEFTLPKPSFSLFWLSSSTIHLPSITNLYHHLPALSLTLAIQPLSVSVIGRASGFQSLKLP